jgi:hypothetical protein
MDNLLTMFEERRHPPEGQTYRKKYRGCEYSVQPAGPGNWWRWYAVDVRGDLIASGQTGGGRLKTVSTAHAAIDQYHRESPLTGRFRPHTDAAPRAGEARPAAGEAPPTPFVVIEARDRHPSNE